MTSTSHWAQGAILMVALLHNTSWDLGDVCGDEVGGVCYRHPTAPTKCRRV